MAADIHPILVIGGGPAGLSIGYELSRRGAPAPILERADAPGDSWRRMPRHMDMNSPIGASCLAGTRVGFLEWPRIWSRERFHRHLLDFAKANRLEIRPNVEVKRVRRDDDEVFRLETSEGPIAARIIVNATGYFGRAHVPERPGASESELLRLTVPEYGSPEALAERLGEGRRRVLIVGKRITAGQIGTELHDAGFEVTISHRSPIEFGLDPRLQRRGFRAYYAYEGIELRRSPAFARRDSGHPMQGGRARRLIESGAIATRPDIAAFEGRHVRFEDGRRERFDVLIWATGYRPVLEHLSDLVRVDDARGLPALREMESVDAPGLFFLGLDQQTDFTSRMLRGIRRDAAWLGGRLATAVLRQGTQDR